MEMKKDLLQETLDEQLRWLVASCEWRYGNPSQRMEDTTERRNSQMRNISIESSGRKNYIFWLRNNLVLTQKSCNGGDSGGGNMLLVLANNQWLTI
jgi:hypothetical protein